MTVVKVELPPQVEVEEETNFNLNEIITEKDATAGVMSGMAMSYVLDLPGEIVKGGILSLQIISHMPLNNVNFPRNELNLMKFLNNIVSFHIFDLNDLPYTPDFTETPPYNVNFEWL